jgi:ribonuclease P protein component
MPYKNFSFGKSERLCSKKLIEELFSNQGVHRIVEHPFLLLWKESQIESVYPAQVLLIVSKKLFPKATDRNHIRRQLRELYRLNKNPIYEVLEKHQKKAAILVIYKDNKIPGSTTSKQETQVLKIQYDKLIEKFIKNIEQTF